MDGILFFCMAYGIIEVSNAIYLNTENKLSIKNTAIITFWGVCILFISIDEMVRAEPTLKAIDYILFGLSWLLMLKAPCNVPLFREKNKYGSISRKIIFIILASIQFITAFELFTN